MKRKWLMWFTLVEILIVIVIIGILIWALVPRMSAAQGRARDVARKNDLAQLQSAIVTSQQDKGRWPGMTSATSWEAANWISIDKISSQLLSAWMNSVPKDPLGSNQISWLGADTATFAEWNYWYMVWRRNWTDNAWFVLMAKTEVEWWSNRVYCEDGATLNAASYCADQNGNLVEGADNRNTCEGTDGNQRITSSTARDWKITPSTDLGSIKTCTSLEKDSTKCGIPEAGGECYYTQEWQLRYILLY